VNRNENIGAVFNLSATEPPPNGSTNPGGNQGNNPSGGFTGFGDVGNIFTDVGGGSGDKLSNPIASPSTALYLKRALQALMDIVAPGLIVLYVISGFLFVAGRGDVARLANAKKFLKYALIATAIALGAWGILNVIGNTLTKILA
jgi:hypothetical protein